VTSPRPSGFKAPPAGPPRTVPIRSLVATRAVPSEGRGTRAARAPRTPHRVPCQVRPCRMAREPVDALCGETVNLSRTGLAVRVPHSLPLDTRVEVLLTSLEGPPLCLYGNVVHVRHVLTGTFEMGIRLATAAEDRAEASAD
jgi:hypothetical protein